jgi:hypothetical protein
MQREILRCRKREIFEREPKGHFCLNNTGGRPPGTPNKINRTLPAPYGGSLLIEKKGFMPLFEAVHLAERYDIAIISINGVSVTAARRWMDELWRRG